MRLFLGSNSDTLIYSLPALEEMDKDNLKR